MFLAVDLAGRVHTVALGGADHDIDSPAWPVRMPLTRMHSWLGSGGDLSEDAAEITAATKQWGVRSADVVLVVLSAVGRERATRLAGALDCSDVCIPRFGYMISPRGVVPAGLFRDYAHAMTPEDQGNLLPSILGWPTVRGTFVDLMEQAAEDVQAARFEQDDSVLDRYAELRYAGDTQSLVVPVEVLNNSDWMLTEFYKRLREQGAAETEALVECVSLHLRCAVELPEMFPRPIDPDELSAGNLLCGTGFQPVLSTGKMPVPHHTECSGHSTRVAIPAGWEWQINVMGHLRCRRR